MVVSGREREGHVSAQGPAAWRGRGTRGQLCAGAGGRKVWARLTAVPNASRGLGLCPWGSGGPRKVESRTGSVRAALWKIPSGRWDEGLKEEPTADSGGGGGVKKAAGPGEVGARGKRGRHFEDRDGRLGGWSNHHRLVGSGGCGGDLSRQAGWWEPWPAGDVRAGVGSGEMTPGLAAPGHLRAPVEVSVSSRQRPGSGRPGHEATRCRRVRDRAQRSSSV